MAGLRNTFSVLTDDGSRDLIDERLTAAGMGTLERSFIGGRVGADANAAASELASLRAAGQEQEAQAVQAQLEQLQQRRGFYAPEVGGVENIGKRDGLLSDGLTWAGEAVGQGAASMLDPIAATAAMNAGGRLLGMSKNPTAQLVSKALSWGAPAVAYGMNHDQLKGEFVQNAMRDPELMARTSWQDLNRTANVQAAGGAVLDTALPTVLGRQLVGKAGMSALGKMAPTSFGGRTLAAMGLEGATEVGQNVGSQIGLGYLNPNRDTSGDFMENVNAFAGGAVGAGPFSAAGAAAEGGYQRMGGVADALGKKAGDTVDLATGAVDSAKNKSRGWAEKLFGSNEAEDLQGGDGAAPAGFKLSPDEYSTLNWAKDNEGRANEPGFDEEFQAQEAKRTEFTVAKLAELAESDDKAADILERAGNAANPTEQIRILSEGSDYLLAKHDLDELDATGRNNLPSKGGELVGRAAKGIAKGAVKVAGEVAKGVARGLSSKKNLQADESAESRAGAEASGLQARNFAAELHPDLPGVQAMAEHIAREIHNVAVSGQVPEGRAMRLAKHMHTIFGNDTLDVLDTIARLAGKEGSPAMRVLALEAGDLNLPGGMQRFREREMQAAKSVLSVIPRTRQEVLLKKGIDINRGKDRAQLMKLLGQLADGTGDAQLRQSLNIALGAQTVAKALEIMNGKALAKGRKATSEEATIFTDQEAEVLGDEMEVNEDGEVTDYVKRQGDKSVDKGRVPSLYRFNQSKVSRNNEASRDPFAPATKVSEGAVRDWREVAKEAKLMGRAAPEDPRVAAAASRPGLFRIGEGIAKELEALKASGKNSREAVQQVLSKHPGIKASTRQLLKEVNNDPNWTVTAKRASDVLDSMGADDTRRLAMYVDYLHKGIKSEGTTEDQKKRLKQKLEIADRALKDIYKGKNAPTDTKSNVADKGGEDSSGIKSLGQERLDAAQRRVAAAREKVKALRKQYAEEQRAGKEAGIDNALTLKDIADAGKAAKDAMQEYQELSSKIIEQNAAPTPEKGQEMTLPHRVRRQVVEEAKAYFAERYVVVAEQLTNRDITKLSVPEFQNMGRVAAEQMDFARQAESRAKSKAAKARKDGLSKEEADAILRQGENETNEIIDASNILEFFPKVSNSERAARKANLAAGRKDDGPKPVYIKAGDLVYWVRQQRGRVEDTSRGTNADHQYLMDLEEGISAVLESGLVANKLPGKRNRSGTLEFFHKSENNKLGVPPSLRLVTKTAKYLGNRWGDDVARIDPAKARTKGEYLTAKEKQKTYETEVAKESMKGETRVPEMAGAERDAIAENTPEQMPGFPSLAEMKRTRQTLRERMVAAGELADNAPEKNSFTSTGPKKTDKDVVPSEMERQRETDEFGRKIAQDEFTDQRFRSEFQGFDPATTIERETKMTAPGQAKDRGDAIRAKLIPGIGEGRTELTAKQLEGINSIAARIRSAYRPEYRTKDDPGLVGGWHYLYPAAHALNADFLDGLKKDKDPAGLVDTLEFLRGQLTRALADSDASLKHKAAIAKLMAPKTSVARINESNVQGTLEKNAPARDESLAPIEQSKTQAAPEVAAAEAPKSQPKPSGADKRNAQDAREPGATPASPKEIAKAKAWMNKVLPKVRVEFEKITGYSGEFIEAENLVRISTTAAAGVMQTAYHEGLHAFFAGLAKNPEAQRVLSSIADNRAILARLQALLREYPAAQKQLVDGEERLAYAFQFWAAGKLSLPVGPAKGFFAKLRKFFRQVAGMITDEEKAADILQAFNDGKLGDPSTAGKVLNDIMSQGTWTKQGLKNLDGMVQMARRLIVPAEEILLRTPSAAAKALAREFYTNPGDETTAGMAEGMINAQRTITAREMNKFAKAVEGLDDKDMINVAELLQKQIDPDTLPKGPYRRAVRMIREQLDDFHTYLKDHNVEVGKIENYFPRAWSLAKLMADPSGFTNMLLTHYDKNLTEIVRAVNLKRMEGGKFKDGQVEMTKEEAALEILNLLVRRNGADGKASVQRDDGVLAPYFSSSERRELGWIQTIHSEPWQNKNLVGIMTSYIHEGVRTAEYAHRFGRKGELLDARLREIEGELVDHARGELAKGEFKNQAAADKWVQRQMKAVRNATGGMEGSLGKDISNGMRKFNSWMMVYQNVRLLPLTLFASVVDPMGMIARGATMREAFDAFQRGVTEVFRNWGDLFRESPKHRDADKWTILAEHIGAVDAAMLSHHVSEEYSSTYLTRGAKQINDTFFKVNGMEAWNRGMRIGAVKNAVAFLQRHKSLPDVHSARWLQELGLTPDAITLDADGDLITDVETLMAQTGVTKGEAQRQIDAIHSALNRWVLSAILTPNAAQRPAWASDPHYSLFFHLKQFSYSFHQTILKRAIKEMNHGNLGPIATFAGYIPVMIASDVMKGLLIGGGELPQHMKGMDLGDWVMRGLERSGTLGIGAIGVDASHDMFSVLGPSAEQVVDGITSPIADTTLRALPLNPILRAVAE